MNASLTVVLLVVNLTLAAAVLGAMVAWSERSRYRYRLWAVRDDLMDRVLKQEFENPAPVVAYIRSIESCIDWTRGTSPFVVALMMRTCPAESAERFAAPSPIDLAEGADRVALVEARGRVHAAHSRLLLLGSPSGWFVAACLGFFAFVSVAAHTLRARRWLRPRSA